MVNKLRFMDGTASVSSYLVIGVFGDIDVGVRPLDLVRASPKLKGHEDMSTFQFRLRAAIRGDYQGSKAVCKDKVVSLICAKKYDRVQDCLPSVAWLNVNDTRASTILSVTIPGNATSKVDLLLEQFSVDKLPTTIAKYLHGLVGANGLLLEVQIAGWFFEYFKTLTSSLLKAKKIHEKMAGVMQDSVGIIVQQAALAASVLESLNVKE